MASLRDERVSRLVLAAALVTLFIVVAIAWIPITFLAVDEVVLISAWSGGRTGAPDAHSEYSGIMIGWMVSSLYELAPAVPWHTIASYTIMWISLTVVCFVVLDNGGIPLYGRILSCLAFLILIALHPLVRIHYTTTAAMAAGAAMLLVFQYERGSRAHLACCCTAVFALSLIAHSLRAIVIVPAMIAIGGIVLAKARFGSDRGVWLLAGSAVLAVGLSSGANSIGYGSPEWREFLRYHKLRERYMDYPAPGYYERPDLYEKVGWGYEEHALVRSWFLMGDFVSADTFQILVDEVDAINAGRPLSKKLSAAFSRIDSMFFDGPRDALITNAWLSYILALAVVTWCASSLRRRMGQQAILAIGSFVLFNVFLLYLAVIDRMLLHPISMLQFLFLTPVFVVATSMFGATQGSLVRLSGALLLSFAFAGAAFNASRFDRAAMRDLRDSQIETSKTMLDYLRSNRDKVFIYDLALAYHLIPDPWKATRDSFADNFIFHGGTIMYSPLSNEANRAIGKESIDQSTLVDDDVYYLSPRIEDAVTRYYRKYFPEYEFVMVDRIMGAVGVYKLTKRASAHQDRSG